MLYLSSFLKSSKYKFSADNLFAALDACGVNYALLPNAKDIWLRDFMPVERRDGKYVSFRYEPSYLKTEPHRRTDFKRDISGQLELFGPGSGQVMYSDINLDGGNIVFSPSKAKAVVSDRILPENPDYERDALLRKLERLLEARIILIPSLPGDLTGHADGMVRFVDEDTVIGNATPYKNGLEQRVKKVLNREGLRVVDFPYYDAQPKENANERSAAGCYLNFLEADGYIFLPVFGSGMDALAVEAARGIFTKAVVPVRIDEIAAEGGCLNCVSWEAGAEGGSGI